MNTLDRLKTYLQRCPAEGERVHMEFLIETWNTLPKLLAVADAAEIMREDFEGVDWLSPGAQAYDKAKAELEEPK